MDKVLITTAIDYVNDVIHIGHAYQKIMADVLARYYRETIGKQNVYFLTGTDENGAKALEAAKAAGKDVEEFVDFISNADKKEQDSLNISYDRFIRTTDSDHIEVVLDFWNRVAKNKNDIYLGDFKGQYCRDCEAFKTASEIKGGRCLIHPKTKLEPVTEKNYFFEWKKYIPFLKGHIKNNPNFVLPESRRNEVLAFVDKIEDITISRRKEAVPWGIEVPGDSTQVIYVWFDALINYLTAGKQKGFWDENTKIIHIIGKDNLRWHALLWPAMLKSAEYPLPSTIYAHGFLTLDGQKISKSLGNIIRPTELVKKYGADAVRYYLLRYTSPEDDNDISIEKLENAYNSDLANGLGNLVARVAKLGEKIGEILIFEPQNPYLNPSTDREKRIKEYIEKFYFKDVLDLIWKSISELDSLLENEKPWEKLKSDKEVVKKLLQDVVIEIQKIAYLIEPFLPATSEMIFDQFRQNKIVYKGGIFPRK
ncbi:MAG: methionine--tRNA ligase [Candidatus Woykebacteria bacterium RBG_13_40_15]|uniref:Methionine--tRNA ligase n=1 Tax=Candidatus Woykebacteria bacterium RBG_13_40_15 TaxID=1802593 RepID=A0A1G1W8W4_9BACT|nr:MAG: methionine--tRNA ligase [Candidatus Woykebacteria bacterium RBG_13_40_15]